MSHGAVNYTHEKRNNVHIICTATFSHPADIFTFRRLLRFRFFLFLMKQTRTFSFICLSNDLRNGFGRFVFRHLKRRWKMSVFEVCGAMRINFQEYFSDAKIFTSFIYRKKCPSGAPKVQNSPLWSFFFSSRKRSDFSYFRVFVHSILASTLIARVIRHKSRERKENHRLMMMTRFGSQSFSPLHRHKRAAVTRNLFRKILLHIQWNIFDNRQCEADCAGFSLTHTKGFYERCSMGMCNW